MEVAKRVTKNTGILYIQMGITVFMSLYTTRLVLAALGVEDFGIFNVVAGAISMLSFLNVAMTSASQRFMSFAQGRGDIIIQNSIFNISFRLHFFIGFVIVLILEILGFFLFDGILIIDPTRIEVAKLVYHIMVASTFFTVIGVPYDAVINAHENMLMVAILRIIEVALKLAIALFITISILAYDKLLIYSSLMALIYVVLYITRLIYCHKKYLEVSFDFSSKVDTPLLKEMGSFAGYSFVGSVSSVVANYGQGIILNMFYGTTVNAAQGVVNQLSGQLAAFSTTMLKALNPVIAKSEGAGDRIFMLKASMLGSKGAFFLMLFLYIPAMVEMPYIFALWLKDVPEYAVIFGRLLMVKILIEQLYSTISTSIMAVGNIKSFQIFGSILSFLPIMISYFLFFLNFEPFVLYIVFVLFAIIRGIYSVYFAKLKCDLKIIDYIKLVFLPCLRITLIMSILILIPTFILYEGIYRLLLILFVSFVSFVWVVWMIELKEKERAYIITFIKSKIIK
jgi:O-antigen/teichoic acid export membrane protein